MCLILFELSAWSSHEVTAAQRNHYHQHSGSALQNSLHHHKVAYNLHNFNHHSGAGKSIPLRTSKIDNKFTDNTKSKSRSTGDVLQTIEVAANINNIDKVISTHLTLANGFVMRLKWLPRCIANKLLFGTLAESQDF